MHMGFADAGRGNLDKLSLLPHLVDGGTTNISHRGTQSTHQLVDHRGHRPLVGHPSFDPFGHQLQLVADFLLEARAQGVAVPDAAIDKAMNAMRQISRPDGWASVSYRMEYPEWWAASPEASKKATERMRRRASAYALYVMAKGGKGDLARLRWWHDVQMKDEDQPMAKAYVAAGLARMGDNARARSAMRQAVRSLGYRDDQDWYQSPLRDVARLTALAVESGQGDIARQLQGRLENVVKDPDALNTQEQAAVLHAAFALLKAAGKDNFMIGGGGGMPPTDMLAFVIGTEQVLLGMAEHPGWIKAAIGQMTANWVALEKKFQERAQKTHAFWYGNAGWMPFWAPESFVATQSDISCMISPAMFEKFIIPELDSIGRECGNVWYHLDGQSAFQHLPRLLSLPYMKVIQFVPMAGTPLNGPAYLDLYRQIQAADKIVHIGVPKENIEPLVRELNPGRLMIDTACRSAEEAGELLAAARRWTSSRKS